MKTNKDPYLENVIACINSFVSYSVRFITFSFNYTTDVYVPDIARWTSETSGN
jgi:hypothetical protein